MIISLVSGSGAPGVTTTALALALHWPRPVILLEADPSGSAAIQSGYLRGERPRERSIADLAPALRTGDLADSLPGVQMRLTDNASYIPGPRSHAQVHSLLSLWHPLASVMRDQDKLGVDVIVDAGRFGAAGHPDPLIQSSDLVLLMCRTTLPSIVGIREWAAMLRAQFTEAGVPDAAGLLTIGAGRPYPPGEISKLVTLPLITTLPSDPVAAEVYSLGAQPGHRHDRSPLVKALPGAVEAILTRRQQQTHLLEEATLHD